MAETLDLETLLGQDKIDTLKTLYNNPENIGALRGPWPLYQEAKRHGFTDISLKNCKDFLHGQSHYVEYKPRLVNFHRNPITTYVLGTVEMDICHMDDPDLVKLNNGYKYVLFMYEELAKYVFAAAIKDKSDSNVIALLEGIFKKYKGIYTISAIYSDKAQEFSSRKLQKFEKQHNIHHYFAESEVSLQNMMDLQIITD